MRGLVAARSWEVGSARYIAIVERLASRRKTGVETPG
jgi:hypothetical protein